MMKAEHERREKIATAMLQGMQTDNPTMGLPPEVLAKHAVEMADALMAELDKEP